MAGLPRFGVNLVAEGAKAFFDTMDKYEKQLRSASDASEEAAQKTQKAGGGFESLRNRVQKALSGFGSNAQGQFGKLRQAAEDAFGRVQNAGESGFGRLKDAATKFFNEGGLFDKLSGSADALDDVFDLVGGSVGEAGQRFTGFLSTLGRAKDAIGGLSPEMLSMVTTIGVATVAVVALTAAIIGFIALGQRGAGLVGIQTAFENITADIDQTVPALQSLRDVV